MFLDEHTLFARFFDSFQSAKLDDFVDRSHYLYTPSLLIFFALLIGSKQTFGDPITCMVPANFPGSWAQYVHQYCFVTGTYHTRNGTHLDSELPQMTIDYYQWVPYFLAVVAVMFYAPHLFWMTLQNKSEVDYESIVERCCKVRSKSQKERKEEVHEIAVYLKESSLIRHRAGFMSSLGWMGTACYLTSKVLNMVNVIFQLHILNSFIGSGSSYWGFKIIDDGLKGIYWDATGFFPRVSYCNIARLKLSYDDSHIVQCALMINMLNEKAFVMIYFWLVLLMIPTMLNLAYSFIIMCAAPVRVWQTKQYLRQVLNENNNNNGKGYAEYCMVRKFVGDLLSFDGLLLLRFVQTHAGFLVASELASELFTLYHEEDRLPTLKVHRNTGGYSNELALSPSLLKEDAKNFYEKAPIDAPSITDSLGSRFECEQTYPASSKC
ncbi:unnamed protein product [Bursaphelenchus xylophilus]|uniref:Innexin n=1 Tax=Bursaphelenchus xylophilus TaxID=6326 RepID=A0A1I7RSM2_BURXY|nr:unnamed protein product [Bursaphelenchus xylophilus]CAG9122871.1 unnamed protein product [Bursaphelenchus xylophilus]